VQCPLKGGERRAQTQMEEVSSFVSFAQASVRNLLSRLKLFILNLHRERNKLKPEWLALGI
jgi:hypothetical protein